MKRIFSVIVIISLILCSLISCGEGITPEKINENKYNADNFLILLSAGETTKAITMFNSTALGHYERVEELKLVIIDFINSAINEYLLGNATLEKAEQSLNTGRVVAEHTDLAIEEVAEAATRLSEIKESKKSYDSGCELLIEGNFVDAIEKFNQVIENDVNYADAQSKTESALKSLKDSVLEQSAQLISEQNYTDALQKIDEAFLILSDDADLKTMQATCAQKYITSVLDEADAALVDPGVDYEKALDILKPAMQKFSEDEKLKQKYEYLMTFVPVSLFDMEPYKCDGESRLTVKTIKDNMGNTYEKAFQGYAFYSPKDGTYDIGKKYNLLSGTVAVEKCDHLDSGGSLKIYGDEKLLKQVKVDKNFKPIEISVDITGVTDLKIEFPKDASYEFGGSVYTASSQAIFANVTLQKTVK